MKISVADIRKKKPCYDPTEIKGITEDTSMDLVDWLKYKSKKLTDADRVWLASRFMSKMQCRVFAIWCARSCKTKVKDIKDYINAIKNYYIKKTITYKELSAANRAAYSAAYWAADWAAYSAADWVAERAAYWAADWAADSAADSAADRAAYWAADRAAYRAARKKQVKYLIKLLKEGI